MSFSTLPRSRWNSPLTQKLEEGRGTIRAEVNALKETVRDLVELRASPDDLTSLKAEMWAIKEQLARIEDHLSGKPQKNNAAELAGRKIIEQVAESHSVTVVALQGKRRELTDFRFEAIYRMVFETPLSATSIGRLLGRDHSSILKLVRTHAVRRGLPLPPGLARG